MKDDLLNSFKEIQVETPVDMIIRQIRELISSGQLNAGDKLPSERQLAEKLAVGRTYVRDAIKKLEFYRDSKYYLTLSKIFSFPFSFFTISKAPSMLIFSDYVFLVCS